MRVKTDYYNGDGLIFEEDYVEINSIEDIHRRVGFVVRNMGMATCTYVVAHDFLGNVVTSFDVRFPRGPVLGSLVRHNDIWNDAVMGGKICLNTGDDLIFNEKVRKNFIKSALICYENASALLEDSRILFGAQCFNRAGSVAILSFEEFGKAMLLHILSGTGEWNEERFNALKSHKKKQAIMMAIMDAAPSLIQMNQSRLFSQGFIFPSSLIASKLNDYHSKQKLDRLKQWLQFTKINRDGTCSLPSDHAEMDSIKYAITLAQKSQYFSGCFLINKYCDIFERITKSGSISYNMGHGPFEEYTIHYSDGYDIKIKACGISEDEMIDSVIRPTLRIAEALPHTKPKKKDITELRKFWNIIEKESCVFDQILNKTNEMGYLYSGFASAVAFILGR